MIKKLASIICVIPVFVGLSFNITRGDNKETYRPPDLKISFIPKPWEINTERHYIHLTEWRFIKEPLSAKAVFYSGSTRPVDPTEF
ncbi:MAG: hypothetical protein AB1546_00635, partial [bacterium]